MSEQHEHGAIDWKHNGVRVIPGDQLDPNTAQTPGHEPRRGDQLRPRRRAEDLGRHGHIHANAKTGAHHHGALESVIYVRARAGRGCAGASSSNSSPRPGPATSSSCRPTCRTRRSTPRTDETLECVLVRSDNEAVVVNLDIEPVEKPEGGPLGRPDPQEIK